MKFHTVVIGKRKLAIAAAAAIFMGAVTAAGLLCTGNEAAFKISDENVLKSGMPNDAADTNVGETLRDIMSSFSENIIARALPGYEESQPPQASESSDPQLEAETAITSEPPETAQEQPKTLPSAQEIAAAPNPEISNATAYTVDLTALREQPLTFKVDTSVDEPQVLVVHTHSTECYDGDAMSGDSERTTDETKNVNAVGQVICDVLEGYSIHCIHDGTVHDYPTYQGAYTRTLSTIQSELEAHPSVKVVLDVHRDAYIYPDGTKHKVSCDINGRETAQVMIVAGTDSMGLYHPNWHENLKLAAKIQSAAQILYPGLMRPINLRTERFNMHMTTGSLLLEVGSNGNTLEQAKYGAAAAAEAIAAALLAD